MSGDLERKEKPRRMRDATFIATYAGPEPGLAVLLDSLLRQTALPREVVLVDGSAVGIVRDAVTAFTEQAGRQGIEVTLLGRPGCGIALGRNIATRNASFDIVASSDTGCELDEEWLRAITEPFEDPGVDAVAGTYRPAPRTLWERATAAFLMPDPDRIARTLPSTRSLAYRKRAWEAAGGFPEHLSHAEDTVFAMRMREAGQNIAFTGRAVVRWRPRAGPVSFFRQIYRYSAGDGAAGIMRGYYLKKATIFAILVVLVLFVPEAPLLIIPIAAALVGALAVLAGRVPSELKSAGVFALLLPVFLIHLLAQLGGFLHGTVRGFRGKSHFETDTGRIGDRS